MFNNRSLAFKLSFYILSCVIIIAGFVTFKNSVYTGNVMLKGVEECARNLCEATVNKLDQTFLAAAEKANDMALVMESMRPTDSQLKSLMSDFLKGSNSNIFGSAVAFEPNRFQPGRLYYSPYVSRDGDKVAFQYLGGKNYQYFYMDWYQIPKQLQRPIWSEPYFDEGGGNVLMTTYSCPFYRTRNGKRIFEGVVTVDISLSKLQKLVDRMRLYDKGYGFLISKFGRIITHPDVSLIMNHTLYSLAEEHKDLSKIKEIADAMIAGKTGFVPYKSLILGEDCMLCYLPLKSNDWSLGIVIPKKELLKGLTKLNQKIAIMWGVGLIALLIVIFVVSYSITIPLKTLTKATKVIGHGDFTQHLPEIDGSYEMHQLAEAFYSMQKALMEHIENLKRTTAEKEKIESELTIARQIQLSIIPKIFPPFPERKELNLFAILESAKAVGGDLYNFFFLDDDNLCFAVGDVSGKGVPASLLMAVTQTLLKATASIKLTPGEILTSMNHSLSQDNEMCMFVTYFLAIFNIKTGELTYSNAGHNPPFILKGSGGINKISQIHGIPLGVMEDIEYGSTTLTLNPGDGFISYTDGVTEAMNRKSEEFTEERLVEVLENLPDSDSKQIVQNVLGSVRVFTDGHEQSDDITILAIRYNG